ncbi:transcriptional regulator [Aeromicrobium flavum]|uniref:Transcriptional regulator n=1 Tax=Aeromicrobium flavum TaxID=416568 RepID=A0A512HU36_9ACTN|nr:MerR family transcriptional regulator [Aeromicrobium flavum]GEO88962.1 transcriptional regulator [Aeromicrobium flavum]
MHRRWTVGALSEMLGIAAPTLRTWERRYGVGPTFRTSGGHRRYTIIDADRVATLARFIEAGVPAQEAAERVKRLAPHELAAIVGGGSEGLRTSGHDQAVFTILAGAKEFDPAKVQRAAEQAIERYGIEEGWDSVIAPAMIEVGLQWEDGRLGVAAEHLVTASILSALRAAAHERPTHGPSRVVLACVEDEQHKLPIVALGAALAKHGHPWTELGARLPMESLEVFVQSSQPDAVFLWSSYVTPPPEDMDRLAAMAQHTRLVLGGTGWPEGVATSHSLSEAVEQLRDALGDDLP